MTTIQVSPEALQINKRVIPWNEIDAIFAYKVDAYVVDQIRFLINAKSGPAEISESDEGWTELVDKLPEYLPGCESMGEWYFQVAFPAFERCERVIYAGG